MWHDFAIYTYVADNKKHNILKAVIIVFAGIFITAGLALLWITQHYKTIIKNKLPGVVARGTDSLYKVSIGDVSINILTRNVTLYNLHIWPDTLQQNYLEKDGRLPAAVVDIFLPEAQLRGIIWADLVADRKLECSSLILQHPQVRAVYKEVVRDSAGPKKKPAVQEIVFAHISMLQPEVRFLFTENDKKFSCYLKGGTIAMEQWKYNTSHPQDTTGFCYAQSAMIKLDTFAYRAAGSLYGIQSADISFESYKNALYIRNLSIRPLVNISDYYRKQHRQTESFNLVFPGIGIEQLDWRKLITEKTLKANIVNLTQPDIKVSFKRIQPGGPHPIPSPYPQQLLQKIKVKIMIQRININKGAVVYTEESEKMQTKGVITFSNIHGYAANVTNDKNAVAANDICKIVLAGNFMGKTAMNAKFQLSLADTIGTFTADAQANDLDAVQIDKASRALSPVGFPSFHVSDAHMHITGNDRQARGSVSVLYSGLKVDILKADTAARVIGVKKGLSSITDKLLIYPDNPMPGKEVRGATVALTRGELISFFIVLRKCVQQGGEKIAIRNEVVQDVADSDIKKQDKHKNFFQKLFSKRKDAKNTANP